MDGEKVILAQPVTYMNRSGAAIGPLLRRFHAGLENLLVVVDNLDLPPGSCRLKRGSGHAGHNGLKSISGYLGKKDYLRLFVGIGHPGRRSDVVDHVLGIPDPDEAKILEEGVHRAASAIVQILHVSVDNVMNELNRR